MKIYICTQIHTAFSRVLSQRCHAAAVLLHIVLWNKIYSPKKSEFWLSESLFLPVRYPGLSINGSRFWIQCEALSPFTQSHHAASMTANHHAVQDRGPKAESFTPSSRNEIEKPSACSSCLRDINLTDQAACSADGMGDSSTAVYLSTLSKDGH